MNNTGKAATLAGTAAALVLAGCATTTTTTGTGAQGTTPASGTRVSASTGANTDSSTSATPEQICLRALGADTVLDWSGGTVGEFEAYQYGGPRATFPLKNAFPGAPAATRGAWCGTKAGPQTTRWWAAIPGHKPATAITITGPGEGVKRGYVPTPPYVP
jgi:hypothetical protein